MMTSRGNELTAMTGLLPAAKNAGKRTKQSSSEWHTIMLFIQ